MTDLSRRTFLIGTAAAVALVATPLKLLPDLQIARGILVPGERLVYDLVFSNFIPPDYSVGNSVSEIRLTRDDGFILAIGLHPLGLFRYVPVPGGEIYVGLDQVLRLEVTPACKTAMLNMFFERDGVRYAEVFDWKDGIATVKATPVDIALGHMTLEQEKMTRLASR